MAAVTQSNNLFGTAGSRTMVTATFTNPADTNTWQTGLAQIDFASFVIEESSGAAADAIGIASISGGQVTLDVQGTVSSARAAAWGV